MTRSRLALDGASRHRRVDRRLVPRPPPRAAASLAGGRPRPAQGRGRVLRRGRRPARLRRALRARSRTSLPTTCSVGYASCCPHEGRPPARPAARLAHVGAAAGGALRPRGPCARPLRARLVDGGVGAGRCCADLEGDFALVGASMGGYCALAVAQAGPGAGEGAGPRRLARGPGHARAARRTRGHDRADPRGRGGGALGGHAAEALPGGHGPRCRGAGARDRARAGSRRAHPGGRGDPGPAGLDRRRRRPRMPAARGRRRRPTHSSRLPMPRLLPPVLATGASRSSGAATCRAWSSRTSSTAAHGRSSS